MKATVITVHNPFNPDLGREIEVVDAGFTVQQWIDDNALVFDYPVLCIVNGGAILRVRWSVLVIEGGHHLVFLRLPQGGGGGGKNPLAVILGLALIYLPFTFAVSTFAKGALIATGTALVAIGLVATPEIPKVDQIKQASPTYSLTAQGNLARIGQAIPVIYGEHRIYPDFGEAPYFDFQNNKQYLYHVMVIGQGDYEVSAIQIEDTPIHNFKEIETQIVYPDGSYSSGKEALFVNNVITSLEVSGSELSRDIDEEDNFVETDLDVSLGAFQPYSDPVAANPVDTEIDRVAVDIEFPFGLYGHRAARREDLQTAISTVIRVQARRIDNNGVATGAYFVAGTHTVTANTTRAFTKTFVYAFEGRGRYEVRVRQVSATLARSPTAYTARWAKMRGYLLRRGGAFVINPAETRAYKIGIDVTFPRGLYAAVGSTLHNRTVIVETQARRIDDEGAALGEWLLLGSQEIVARTNNVVRKSFTYDLAEVGRYEVAVTRKTPDSTTRTVSDAVHLAGVRAFLATYDSDQPYAGLTLLLVKMRATGNLSAVASRKINCFVRRKIPTWTPENGWTGNVFTRSIPWALADMLRNKVYGAGWKDARVNLKEMYALDRELADRGDTFNYVFDRRGSLKEALILGARAGRATPIMPGGVFLARRDKLQRFPLALFSHRNIVKDSFLMKFDSPTEATADGVVLTYVNPKTWKSEEVIAALPGVTPDRPARVTLAGVTSYRQAMNEAHYILNTNRLRRTTITLTTELEGLMVGYGSLVLVSHDVPSWGISGDVTRLDNVESAFWEGRPVICVSEAGGETGRNIGLNNQSVVVFRAKDGSLSSRIPVELPLDDAAGLCLILKDQWTQVDDPDGVTSTITSPDGSESVVLYYGGEYERTQFTFGDITSESILGLVTSMKPRGETKVELTILIEDEGVHAT